jgi:hypothetical protein
MRSLSDLPSPASLATGKGNPSLPRSFRGLPHHFRTALFLPLLVMLSESSLDEMLITTASLPTDKDQSQKFVFPDDFAKAWWGVLILLQSLVRVVGCSAIYAFDRSLDSLPAIEDLNLLAKVASKDTIMPNVDLVHEVNWLFRFAGTAAQAQDLFAMVESLCWEMMRNLFHITHHFPESIRNLYPGCCGGGVNIAWRLSGPSRGGFK